MSLSVEYEKEILVLHFLSWAALVLCFGCLVVTPSYSVGVGSNPDCLIFLGTLPTCEAGVMKQGDINKCAPEPSPTIIYRSI